MTRAPTIVITMAGASSRFAVEGVRCPKWKLRVNGQTVLWWSLRSLTRYWKADALFLFIAQREHFARELIEHEATTLGISHLHLLEIDNITEGQAATVMAAQSLLGAECAIGVYNIDTHVNPEHLPLPPDDCDGWIPYFSPGAGSWSYLLSKPSGQVTRVAEKIPISTHASVGFYYFARMGDFVMAYQDSAFDPLKERYVAPLYNVLIERGARILSRSIPREAVMPLGTPAELDAVDRTWRESAQCPVLMKPRNEARQI
jgi:hypothetical protein